jgi:hypothetical protein
MGTVVDFRGFYPAFMRWAKGLPPPAAIFCGAAVFSVLEPTTV